MTTSGTYDDDGFDANYIYQVKSVNPGWQLLVFTIAYGLAVVYFIPTLVFIQRRNEWYKKLKTKVRSTRKKLQERREKAADEREAAKTCTATSSPESDATPYRLETDEEAKEGQRRAKHNRTVVRKGLKKGRRGTFRPTTTYHAKRSFSRPVVNDDASVDSYSSVAKSLFLGIDGGQTSTHASTRGQQKMELPVISEGEAVETPSEQVHMNAESCDTTTCQVDGSSQQMEDATANKNSAKQTLSFYDVFDKRVTLWDMLRPDEHIAQINKTAAPWIVQRLCNDANEIIVVALLSRFVGNDAMLAYVAVELVLGVFSSLYGGIYSASYRHASIAANAGDHYLAGQYCQISILYNLLAGIPTVVFAILFMDEALTLLGFSQHVVDIAHSYSFVWAISSVVESFDESWSSLLDICDDGKFGAILDFYRVAIELSISTLAIAAFNVNSLFLVSVMWLAGTVFFTWRKMKIVHRSGKLLQFYSGLSENSLRNTNAVKVMTKACIPAIAQCFLFDIEWRLFALVASYIGPAEAASWILLEKVWVLSEIVVENFSEAVAPKISSFLMAGEVVWARALAYKSLFVGALYGAFSSCILIVLGPLIAKFMTTDSTLQTLLR